MKRTQLLITLAAVGLLSTSIAFAQGGPPQGGGRGSMHHPGNGMQGFRARRAEVMKELDLTDAQKTKIADIRDRQMRKGIQQQADLRIASLDLGKLMRADKPDQRAIDSQIDKMATMRASLQKARIGAMLEMRSVLTDDQRQKLKDLRMKGGGGMGMGRGMGMGMGLDDDEDDDAGPGADHVPGSTGSL